MAKHQESRQMVLSRLAGVSRSIGALNTIPVSDPALSRARRYQLHTFQAAKAELESIYWDRREQR